MRKYSILLFRLSLGGIFIYFGYLAISDFEATAFRFADPRMLELATNLLPLKPMMITFGIMQIAVGGMIVFDKFTKIALTIAAFLLLGIIVNLGVYDSVTGVNELALRDIVILTSVIYFWSTY